MCIVVCRDLCAVKHMNIYFMFMSEGEKEVL